MLLSTACTTTKIVNSLQSVTIPEASNKNVTFDKLFKLKTILPLETNDDCLISSIDRIIISNNKIIILNKGREVLIFDQQTGKFINKIANVGNGVGEYRHLMDIAYNEDENQLILYSDYKYLLFYKMDGKFVDRFKAGESLFEKITYDKGKIYFYNSLSDDSKKIIQVFDLNKKEFTEELGTENVDFNIRLDSSPIVKSKSIWYVNPLQNYISKISNDVATQPYEINTKNFGNEDELIKLQSSIIDFIKTIDKNKVVYTYTSVKETDNRIYLKSNLHELIIIRKSDNKVNYITNIQDKQNGFKTLKYFAHDSPENTILFISQSDPVYETNTNNSPIPKNTLRESKLLINESNPVLVFYTEKQ